MGIWDFVKGELIDVIEWIDDPGDIIVWRFPDQNHDIKMGAKLTVREGQAAVFVNEGQIAPVIDNKEALMLLHQGPRFSEYLKRGKTAHVQLISDGRKSNRTCVLLWSCLSVSMHNINRSSHFICHLRSILTTLVRVIQTRSTHRARV